MATLIFDFDGTLHNTVLIYGPAVRMCQKKMAAMGLLTERDISDSEIYTYIGLTAAQMWKIFAPHLSDEERTMGSEMIKEDLSRLALNGSARLYDGAEKMLERLKAKGHTLIFLSACHNSYMKAHTEYFHLDRYFHEMYCSEEFGWISKEKIVEQLLDKWKSGNGTGGLQIIAIGDRYSDMEIKNASDNIKTIWCAYGFGSISEGETADETAESLMEIPAKVQKCLTCNT